MIIALIAIAAILAIAYIIGSYFVNYAIARKERPAESFNPEDAGGGSTGGETGGDAGGEAGTDTGGTP